MSENPYQPVPAESRTSASPLRLAIVLAVLGLVFGAFLVGYLFGHAAGFWDSERLHIGDEAAGVAAGERP